MESTQSRIAGSPGWEHGVAVFGRVRFLCNLMVTPERPSRLVQREKIQVWRHVQETSHRRPRGCHFFSIVNFLLWKNFIFLNVYVGILAAGGGVECKSARSQREDGMLEWEDLKGMDYMKMVIMEALRIESPVIGGFKLARESIVYKGVTIPKGWKVHYCIRPMHLDEQYFKNPKEFMPERFEKGREEAYSFVPFGQGPRMCPGKDLAKTVMGLMAYHLVMNHNFSLYHFKEGSIKSFFSIQPLHGLPLLLKPCKSSSM